MSTPTWRVMVGDVRARLAELPAGSVQCCVTSPPYWGLRDYGVAGQLGLEPTPDAYVAAMVDVFAGVWRVLKDDGVLWLNLGDSYAMSTKGSSGKGDKQVSNVGTLISDRRWRIADGLKAKDLVGIPWRVAFALQAAGWYLRSDVIWSKPNPMPESVTDRPTKAHEYIFLLTKSERYFYDAEAISEPASVSMLSQMEQGYDWLGIKDYEAAGVQNPSSVKARIIEGARRRAEVKRGKCYQNTGNIGMDDRWSKERRAEMTTRNCRSVWSITTQPYPEAHFATFPEAIPERCIKAGSRIGDTVLDPFTGSGTTGQVAIQCGRSFIGIELNPAYAELARTRIGGAAPLFSTEVA
jgi:DNA modification methylase